MLQPYIPLLLLTLFVVANAIIMIGLSQVLSTYRSTAVKHQPYESGMPVLGDSRGRFSVKFYLVAMLFILFDIEVAFLFPWATVFRRLGVPGFWEMATFIAVLLLGYIYVLRRGALDWD